MLNGLGWLLFVANGCSYPHLPWCVAWLPRIALGVITIICLHARVCKACLLEN
jgi:hypothetical protein